LRLDSIVPWGRNLAEYQAMFNLSADELKTSRILGCGDGPASFNVEASALGADVISVDPVYQFSAEQIRSRIEAVSDTIEKQLSENRDHYLWTHFASPQALVEQRLATMDLFLADYADKQHTDRYQCQCLPDLDFDNDRFDLALCSHYLFLYSEHITEKAHLDAIHEMLRVAGEVRIYPLVTLRSDISPHLQPVIRHFEQLPCHVQLKPVSYTFQKNATQMLLISRN
jgi:hypothetical protein